MSGENGGLTMSKVADQQCSHRRPAERVRWGPLIKRVGFTSDSGINLQTGHWTHAHGAEFEFSARAIRPPAASGAIHQGTFLPNKGYPQSLQNTA